MKNMKKIEKWIESLNKQQKNIIAVIVPVFLLIICMAIAKNVDTNFYYKDRSAFDFGKTYWIWLITIGLIGFVEFKIFKK